METVSAMAFTTGGVQLIKKLGVKGDGILIAWAFILGGLYSVGAMFYPGFMDSFLATVAVVGTQVSGNTGLAFELLKRVNGSNS